MPTFKVLLSRATLETKTVEVQAADDAAARELVEGWITDDDEWFEGIDDAEGWEQQESPGGAYMRVEDVQP